MNWRLPRPTRACCCLPLRRGIIAFVYLNLMLALTAHCVFFIMDYYKIILRFFMASQRKNMIISARSKVTYITTLVLIIGGGLAEIIMTVVALIGLHRKSLKIVAAYLYYTVVYTALMVTIRTLNFVVEIWEYEIPPVAIFIAIKVYYILLLRSQVKKMKQNGKEESAQVELNTIPDNMNICVENSPAENALDKSDSIDDTTQLVRNESDPKITPK